MLILTEILIGSGSILTSSALSITNPSIGIVVTSSTVLLTSIAILIKNEHISKLNIRYVKLKYWINFIEILYDKTLNQPRVDKKIEKN